MLVLLRPENNLGYHFSGAAHHLARQAKLAGQWSQGLDVCLTHIGITSMCRCHHTKVFFKNVGPGVSSSDPHVCMVNTLLRELSLRPQPRLLRKPWVSPFLQSGRKRPLGSYLASVEHLLSSWGRNTDWETSILCCFPTSPNFPVQAQHDD